MKSKIGGYVLNGISLISWSVIFAANLEPMVEKCKFKASAISLSFVAWPILLMLLPLGFDGKHSFTDFHRRFESP